MSELLLITELDKLLTPCDDKEHLQLWIKKFLGFELPDCRVTEYADSDPLTFVWDVYRAIMDGESLDIMGLAGRGSGKTLAVSIIDLLSLLHDQRSCIHIGVTTEQASRARDYFDGYLSKIPELKGLKGDEKNKRKVTLLLDGNPVSLEIISLKPERVQGPHYPLVSIDELASARDKEVIKAYNDSAGIPVSSNKGKPSVQVKITSRQSQASVAETEIANAHKTGLRVVKWTSIDVMQRCPEERSGTIPTPVFINTLKGLHYTAQEFGKLTEASRDGFSLAPDTMDKCLRCPLLHFCKGRARFQTSTSPILSTIQDIIKKVVKASHEWTLSQIMSLKASSESLIFHEFSKEIHQPGWNKMWEVLTGKVPTAQITRAIFLKKCIELNLTFGAGEDWGYTNPATCVVAAIDSRDNVFVLAALGAVGMDDPDWIQYILDKVCPVYPIEMHVPDPENPSGLSLMRKANLHVLEVDKSKGSVWAGINTIKRFLKVPGKNKETKIFFAPDLESTIPDVPGIIEEFGIYEKDVDKATGKPIDGTVRDGVADHYCVSPDTMILTKDGAKQINEIQVGEEVLSHDGRFHKVSNISISDFEGELSRVEVAGREPLLITDNHPLWIGVAKRSSATENGVKLTGQLRIEKKEPEWIVSPDIKVRGDKKTAPRPLAIFPLPALSHKILFDMKPSLPDYLESKGWLWARGSNGIGINAKARPVHRMQEIDPYLSFVMGYFAAEGAKTGNSDTNHWGVAFASHSREKIVDDLVKKVAARFGASTSFAVHKSENGKQLLFNSKALYRFFACFGKGTSKRLPGYAMGLERNECLHLVAGYLFGDGHFGKSGLVAGSISRELAYQIFTCLARLGYCPNIKRAIRKGRWAGLSKSGMIENDQWIVRLKLSETRVLLGEFEGVRELREIFKDKNVFSREVEIDGGHSWAQRSRVYSVIHSIEKVPYSGPVYNLTVEGSHSYVANGVTIHNCDALRYLLYHLYGKTESKVMFTGMDNPQQDQSILSQVRKQHGVQINDNRDEFDEQGNPKKPDDDPNKGGGGGGMSFNWT